MERIQSREGHVSEMSALTKAERCHRSRAADEVPIAFLF